MGCRSGIFVLLLMLVLKISDLLSYKTIMNHGHNRKLYKPYGIPSTVTGCSDALLYCYTFSMEICSAEFIKRLFYKFFVILTLSSIGLSFVN